MNSNTKFKGILIVLSAISICVLCRCDCHLTAKLVNKHQQMATTQINFPNQDVSSNELTLTTFKTMGTTNWMSREQKANLKTSDFYVKGAKAKFTIQVLNMEGIAVPQAFFHAGFIVNERNIENVELFTDDNGYVTIEGNTIDEINYFIKKDGYYSTTSTLYLTRGMKGIKDNNWEPWNPTLKIRLKEIRNPYISTYKRVDLSYPKREKVAFDMIIGDWVAPLGKGVSSDFIMYYDSLVGNDNHKIKKLTIITPLSLNDGFIKLTKDVDSRFPFYYEAPTSGYRSTLNFERERTANKIISNISLGKDEYLVFRITREGKIHYGLLLDLEFGESGTKTNEAGLIFTYYFNSTPNDRNLEVDLSHASGRKNGS